MNDYTFKDIYVGMEESFSVTITEKMMEDFSAVTGDINPLHRDESFAREKGFDSKVVYGMLTASFLSTMAGVYLPGKNSLIYGMEIDFSKPVYVGDELLFSGKVTDVFEGLGCFNIKIIVRNQNNVKVCRGKMRLGVRE